ncbi:MAG: hypothetical protein HKN47_24140 [Pirellulaceae bacterium]|nr:hypothetical protein [Pirellulaceae bacterium]
MVSDQCFRAAFLLFLSVAAVCQFNVRPATAQDSDPFQKDPFFQDPFGGRSNEKPDNAARIAIRFTVLDHKDQPVAGARIVGPGIVRSIQTDALGRAICRPPLTQLAKNLQARGGELTYTMFPPRGLLVPKVTRTFSADSVNAGKTLRFRTRPGVQLKGKVVGKLDGEPVKWVTVYACANSRPIESILSGSTSTTTDKKGEWNLVIPRIDSHLTVGGKIAGYVLSHDADDFKRYAQTIDVPEDVDVIDVPDFQLTPIAPVEVTVVNETGDPIADASARVYYQKWLSPRIVIWEQLSEGGMTGPNGKCVLSLFPDHAATAVVMAERTADGVCMKGRIALADDASRSLTVVLRPPTRLSGTLTWKGRAAANIDVVVYESIHDQSGRPRTISVRAEGTTDQLGHYEIEVPVGQTYLVTLKRRTATGVQPLVHQCDSEMTADGLRIPDVDISKIYDGAAPNE